MSGILYYVEYAICYDGLFDPSLVGEGVPPTLASSKKLWGFAPDWGCKMVNCPASEKWDEEMDSS